LVLAFFPNRKRHTTSKRDWSSDVCSSDLTILWDQMHFQGGEPAWNWLYFIIGPFPALNYYRMYFYKAKPKQAKRETVALVGCFRSEERRVGEECSCRGLSSR